MKNPKGEIMIINSIPEIKSLDINKPIVSVIISTYNRFELVQKTIDSVLAQTYQNIQIIVIDDGSTDGTEKVLSAKYGDRIVYRWQENQGESIAFNNALKLSKGRYIATLGSDDVWLPEKLERQVSVLESDPDLGTVFCQAWKIDGNGKLLSEIPMGKHFRMDTFDVENLIISNGIPGGGSTCLIRQKVLEEIGGFAENIRYGEDWDLWLRIAVNHKMTFISEPLVLIRRHRSTQSYFPSIEYVDDTLNDHLTLLEHFYKKNQDRIPSDLYVRSIANQYFLASMATYFICLAEKARARLEISIKFDQHCWLDKEYFSDRVVSFANGYAIDQDGNFSAKKSFDFVDYLCNNLPEQLNSVPIKKLIKGKARVSAGFTERRMGNLNNAIRYVFIGVCIHPKLLNLGVLALFAEKIIGRKIADRLREIRTN